MAIRQIDDEWFKAVVSGDWRIETAAAGGPWTIIGEGIHE